ncbi:MAG: metalloprotease [Candidatus Woesearchaeota archaeon]|jgi:Zn-dependent protease
MYFAQPPHQKKIWGIPTSNVEINDLLKAWLVVSIAFTVLHNGFSLNLGTLLILFLSAVTVGTGFLLHELAHKIVAQKYHCWAEFRADNMMLMLALFSSMFGFLFAAPGAVIIYGPHITPRQNGIISVAGPLVNYLFALLFLTLLFVSSQPYFQAVALYGFLINSWLGLFNLIPFLNFDGAKIIKWNYFIWGAMVCVGIGLIIFKTVFFGV